MKSEMNQMFWFPKDCHQRQPERWRDESFQAPADRQKPVHHPIMAGAMLVASQETILHPPADGAHRIEVVQAQDVEARGCHEPAQSGSTVAPVVPFETVVIAEQPRMRRDK